MISCLPISSKSSVHELSLHLAALATHRFTSPLIYESGPLQAPGGALVPFIATCVQPNEDVECFPCPMHECWNDLAHDLAAKGTKVSRYVQQRSRCGEVLGLNLPEDDGPSHAQRSFRWHNSSPHTWSETSPLQEKPPSLWFGFSGFKLLTPFPQCFSESQYPSSPVRK